MALIASKTSPSLSQSDKVQSYAVAGQHNKWKSGAETAEFTGNETTTKSITQAKHTKEATSLLSY